MVRHLSEHVTEAHQLSWDQFVSANPHRVLVIIPPGEDTSSSGIQTLFADSEENSTCYQTRPSISDDYLVRPLKKRVGGHAFSMFVTVGRASNNDIVLKDIEVSKVHAFFEEDAQGNWWVRDNNSTNGTYVNGSLIPTDEKTLLRSSDTLKFSAGVAAVFFDTADFYQFLRSNEVVEAFKET